uniref:Uncharacterized protein n=1 Tax=Acrobeloides nanus TaxID=290746 RepID=A0A914CB39_9BILA
MAKDAKEAEFIREAKSRFNFSYFKDKDSVFQVIYDGFKLSQDVNVCYTNDVIRKNMNDNYGGEWAIILTWEQVEIIANRMSVFLEFIFPNGAKLVITGDPDDFATLQYPTSHSEL